MCKTDARCVHFWYTLSRQGLKSCLSCPCRQNAHISCVGMWERTEKYWCCAQDHKLTTRPHARTRPHTSLSRAWRETFAFRHQVEGVRDAYLARQRARVSSRLAHETLLEIFINLFSHLCRAHSTTTHTHQKYPKKKERKTRVRISNLENIYLETTTKNTETSKNNEKFLKTTLFEGFLYIYAKSQRREWNPNLVKTNENKTKISNPTKRT